MKIALYAAIRDGDANELAPLVEADAQGYAAAWIARADPTRGLASLHPLAAHLATRTAQLRVGVVDELTSDLHPLRVAEEIAMLDVLSGGRLDWAVRARVRAGDDAGDERRFSEQLAVARRALSGARFAHEGEFYSFPSLQCFPQPVQQPAPRCWLEVQDDPDSEPETCTDVEDDAPARWVGPLVTSRALASLPGDQDSPLAVVRCVHVGPDHSTALETAEKALRAEHARWRPDREFDRSVLISGDPAACREQVSALRERAGPALLLAWHGFGGLAAQPSQRLFAEQVAAREP